MLYLHGIVVHKPYLLVECELFAIFIPESHIQLMYYENRRKSEAQLALDLIVIYCPGKICEDKI